ncbi:MAG: hypothetical protein IPG43_18690 [Proteobacteria bacterium]|nr:hypothetical protein [Pseudomonadota bacterium]
MFHYSERRSELQNNRNQHADAWQVAAGQAGQNREIPPRDALAGSPPSVAVAARGVLRVPRRFTC